ncbi:putative oxidoreductase [BD1-7 clade bacterium]|uniref:Putative oxidoreductase n=1 Tax=BD1-7 clade bacterium TaxID=2029982 RepID=A0A5S9Q6N9_9GAMM|nr:putative oxidoreductase [BD1-7 clade bacterium]CAA0114319.1 putative oxidoreductase [BD1-7 clade bacterium]
MDKVVLITGANRGIGLAVARHLNTLGYTLSLGVRHPESIPEDLKHCHHGFFDAKDASSATSWVNAVNAAFGRIDGLVHCAGLLIPFGIDDDESLLDEMYEVNVKGTLRICRAVLPFLKTCEEGRIINLVSMSGKRVKGKNIGYGMTKFAQYALTQGLKNIGWDDGVRATSVCPSWVNTDMAITHSNIAPADMTQPEDIAKLTATLLELPNTAYIGEVLVNCSPD